MMNLTLRNLFTIDGCYLSGKERFVPFFYISFQTFDHFHVTYFNFFIGATNNTRFTLVRTSEFIDPRSFQSVKKLSERSGVFLANFMLDGYISFKAKRFPKLHFPTFVFGWISKFCKYFVNTLQTKFTRNGESQRFLENPPNVIKGAAIINKGIIVPNSAKHCIKISNNVCNVLVLYTTISYTFVFILVNIIFYKTTIYLALIQVMNIQGYWQSGSDASFTTMFITDNRLFPCALWTNTNSKENRTLAPKVTNFCFIRMEYQFEIGLKPIIQGFHNGCSFRFTSLNSNNKIVRVSHVVYTFEGWIHIIFRWNRTYISSRRFPFFGTGIQLVKILISFFVNRVDLTIRSFTERSHLFLNISVHFVEIDIAKQRAKNTTLRSSLDVPNDTFTNRLQISGFQSRFKKFNSLLTLDFLVDNLQKDIMVNGVKTFTNVRFNYPTTVMKLYTDLVKSAMTAFTRTEPMGKIGKHWFIYSRESYVLCSLDNFVASRRNTLGSFFLRVRFIDINSFNGLESICSFVKLVGDFVHPSHVNSVLGFLSNSRSYISRVTFHFFVGVNLTIVVCIIIHKIHKNSIRVLFTQFSQGGQTIVYLFPNTLAASLRKSRKSFYYYGSSVPFPIPGGRLSQILSVSEICPKLRFMPSLTPNIQGQSNVISGFLVQRTKKTHWILVINGKFRPAGYFIPCGRYHVCYPNHIWAIVALCTSKKSAIIPCTHFTRASHYKISFIARLVRFNTNEDPRYSIIRCVYVGVNPNTLIRWRTIVKLTVSSLYSRSCASLFHTNKLTHCCCNYTRPSCKNKIHNSNVFCICTTKPTNEQIIPFIVLTHHINL